MKRTNDENGRKESTWLFRSMAIGWMVVLAILLVNIVSSPSDIGSPATESQAVVRANERLLEMVKWTISTILLVGGGLIGLNWYQHEKRLDDRLNQTISNVESLLQERTSVLLDRINQQAVELESTRSEVSVMRSELLDSELDRYISDNFKIPSESLRRLRRATVVSAEEMLRIMRRNDLSHESKWQTLSKFTEPLFHQSFLLSVKQALAPHLSDLILEAKKLNADTQVKRLTIARDFYNEMDLVQNPRKTQNDDPNTSQ